MTELPDLSAHTRFDGRLREVATDARAVEEALGRALGYAGEAARVLGRLDEAIAYLRRSFALARGPRAEAAALIRLGEAFRCADRLDEAEGALRRALELSAGGELEHFARQHLGKCLLDAGRSAEAVEQLERALALRKALGDEALVASTVAALERASGRGGAAPG